ncbi:Acyl-CoA ligase azaF, partial [Lachnellula suecica]
MSTAGKMDGTMDIVSWTFEKLDPSREEPAYIDANDPTRYLTANTVRKLVRQLVAGFTDRGLQKRDCVCVVSFNDIYYTALYLGIIGAGGCFTGANPGYTVNELSHHLTITGSKYLLVEAGVLETATTAAKKCSIPLSNVFVLNYRGEAVPDGNQSWMKLLNKGEKDWVRVKDPATTPAAYFGTSGTTGLPKAAVITHAYLTSQGAIQEEIAAGTQGLDPYIISTPAFHAFTTPVQHVLPLRFKSKPAYILPRFHEETFMKTIQEHAIRTVVAVPPMLLAMSKHPASTFVSVRDIYVGGSSLPSGVVEEMYEKLRPEARVRQVFGMTEVGRATTWRKEGRDGSNGIGEPLPNFEFRVVNEHGTVLLEPGATGELQIRAPYPMLSYLHNEQATTEAFTADSWLRSGDIGYTSSAGNWYIVDRAKDLFKVRGWQVSPAEIEAALLEHPEIADAGVIGVPAGDGCGESPAAFVVRNGELDAEGVRKWVGGRLAGYKAVREVRFVEAIPRSAVGKILRRELRDMYKTELAVSSDVANLGILGRLYSCLNDLGFYRCTALVTTCSYSTEGLSDPDTYFTTRFNTALYQTIAEHPTLCYGIIDQTPSTPAHFRRLPFVHLNDVLEHHTQNPSHTEEQAVIALLETSHKRRLFEGDRKPSWRVVLLRHSSEKITIAFLANHAIADALSHVNFMRSLLGYFNAGGGEGEVEEEVEWPYKVPGGLRRPVVMDECVDLALPLLVADPASTAAHEAVKREPEAEKIWTGEKIFHDLESYVTLVRLVTIPHAVLQDVLAFCRGKGITLTGSLTALTVSYLAGTIPEGRGLRAIVPYSMRGVTGVSAEEICNHASALACTYPTSLIEELRVMRGKENCGGEMEEVE